MPIESFYEMLVIDTPEKAEALVRAFEAAEKRGPYVPSCDIMKKLEEDKRIMEEYFKERNAEKEKDNPGDPLPNGRVI
ncbi:MAG: hypothetical protein FWG41_00840 [Methanomassiliicoccaceae archaeon]|nr:hypothetical protein [Methanomassiliicoccaceae archaeon]